MLHRTKYLLPVLSVLLLLVLICAIRWGALPVSLQQMRTALVHYLSGQVPSSVEEGVFLQLRLPRVLLCALTGAILAVSGVLMQGLFRNPIVEPGLMGTSAGAAFGASIVFVCAPLLGQLASSQLLLVPLFAFIGALLATMLVYSLAGHNGHMAITTLLLAGIAINAIALSGTGFMSYIGRDAQARSITFWNMGTFSGASWTQVFITGACATLCFTIAFRYARQLNLLILGETEAAYLGADPAKLRRNIILVNTLMVSVATSFVGVIGFMGLVVPHIMRLITGSDHRRLLPAAMLCGAILLTLADMGARLLLAPAEMPVGILTSVTGAPVFILLLKQTALLRKNSQV